MSHRWYVRSGAAAAILFFAHATATVPALEAAGLVSGEQRYGIDQDGNVVVLTPRPAADEGAAPPLAVPLPVSRGVRYGLNQNGELQPLADVTPAPAPTAVAAAPTPEVLTQVAPRSVTPPVVLAPPAVTYPAVTAGPAPAAGGQTGHSASGIAALLTTKLSALVTAVSRGGRTLAARITPLPAPAATIRSAAPASRQAAAPAPVTVAKGAGHPGAPTPVPAQGPTSPRSTGIPPQKQATVAAVATHQSRVPDPGSPASRPGRYSLKIDSLKVRSAVRPVVENLARHGIAVREERHETASMTVHRLVVGTFATQEEARECLRTVQPKLKKAYLMSHNGTHGVYCGSFFNLKKAEATVAGLKHAGVLLSIRRDSVAVRHTTLLAGSQLTRDDARDVSRRLRQMGIPAVIVSDRETLAEPGNAGRG